MGALGEKRAFRRRLSTTRFRHALTCAIGAAGLVFASGCGGSTSSNPLAQYQQNGINEGVTDLVPLSYEVNGTWTGEEVDIVNTIMKKLGITKINIVPVSSIASLLASLGAGRTNMVDNLIIRPDRCGVVNFSQPYLGTYPALAVAEGNPDNLHDLADVKTAGVNIGVIAGSQDLIASEGVGISSSHIQQYPSMTAAMTALSQGRVQAVSSDVVTLTAGRQAAGLTSSVQLVGPVDDFYIDGVLSGTFYDAFAFGKTKSEVALQNAFDQQLAAMIPSGTAAIGAKYEIPANAYQLTATKAALCAG